MFEILTFWESLFIVIAKSIIELSTRSSGRAPYHCLSHQFRCLKLCSQVFLSLIFMLSFMHITLDPEKLLMRTLQFSFLFEISQPLTCLIMLSPRTTTVFFSADMLQLRLLSCFSLQLILITLSTCGFLMTDSGC